MAKDNKAVTPVERFSLRNQSGYALSELAIVVAIAATIAAIAIPNYISYRNRANIASAIAEIKIIELAVGEYMGSNSEMPDSLDDLNLGIENDPWGNPYQYLNIDGGGAPALAIARRDHFNVPVNSDFDLFSRGKDGSSAISFAAAESSDDIVRADDGGYVGLVSKY